MEIGLGQGLTCSCVIEKWDTKMCKLLWAMHLITPYLLQIFALDLLLEVLFYAQNLGV
jgi:hypothetical protein